MSSQEQIGGFILAGGESSRMGRDKALLELNGFPLVVRAARLAELVARAPIVVGDPGKYEPLGLRVVGDGWPGAGPLGGIATALRVSQIPWNLVVACDLPYLTGDWLEYLVQRALASREDAVVPISARGLEPLCAVYHQRCEASARQALEGGMRKVVEWVKSIHAEMIHPIEWKAFDSEGFLFKNMNSPEDYDEARARLDRGAKSPGK